MVSMARFVISGGSFGNLDHQALRLDVGLLQRLIEHGQEFGIDQIGGRDIDADVEVGTVLHDGGKVLQRVAQDGAGDRSNETGLFGDFDKDIGRNNIAVFVGPSRERFCADNLPRRQVDDGLIDDGQLVMLNGAAKLLGDFTMMAISEGEAHADEDACQAAGNSA